MNKSDLIAQLAEKKNLPAKEATYIVNTILETMTDVLTQGKSIEIRGFGRFSVKEYEAYEGRNPRSGKKIKVQPKKLPAFKAGKDLRERVNEGK